MEVLRLTKMGVVWISTVSMMMVIMELGNGEELHYVGGGKTTWAPGINFSDWSSRQQFYKGDWLYFGFDKARYNVLEVNKTSYENCIDQGFIKNITKGGRDVFQLTETITYYFLSGNGYCFQGMKVSINVQDAPTNLPPSHPPKTASASSSSSCSSISHIITPLLLLFPTAFFPTFFS
ncbi:early nodulin-like protein 20 [Ziziphus jujuba]|uniref:Early nodulin-like protein 20 n=2 Tax=Ziziphus jujuba TaxID=326968 RepID=A0A6P3Z7T3_ZIZJJ|nr:early nodulin-like protein 20 [Ziziphus jujuba]KAH7541925.1 hypothetical protein FEM48_Zijuj02G0019100 [Ziziphus jujuba var. spinosa]